MNRYIRIELNIGSNITDAYNVLQTQLKQHPNEKFYTDFNGQNLTSDMSEDECYMTIVNKTKAQFEEEMLRQRAEGYEYQEEHKLNIPNICSHYEKESEGRIDPEDIEYFKEILPIRVGDLYRGMEIQCLFDLIDCLNNKSFNEAVKMFNNQEHSGGSALITARLVRRFHKELGNKFYNEVMVIEYGDEPINN